MKTRIKHSSWMILGIIAFQLFANLQPVQAQKIRFGICSDIHKDIMYDADARLSTFIKESSAKPLDFIIELGDFCRPYDSNKDFLAIWDQYKGTKFHVIGNHDNDGGFSHTQVASFWGMPAPYYSFDKKGYHFIILNTNEKNPSPKRAGGYPRFIGDEQIKWLANDIHSTSLPCIIFSHQTIENNPDGIENREQVRKLFEDENKAAGFNKIVACFSGHHHTDYATCINDIYYVQINSMSYEWLGEAYQTVRFSKEIDNTHPWIKYTIPYKDPLFAFIEINNKSINIKGKKSSFVGPSPAELHFPTPNENEKIVPQISNRKLYRK